MPPLRCANAPTPAKLFVQLSMRRQAISPSPALPILDLLLPRLSTSAGEPSLRARRALSTANAATATTYTTYPFPCPRHKIPTLWQQRLPGATSSHHRSFTTTPSRRATHTIFNPQLDEDGNEMRLEITPRAAKRLTEIMAKDHNPYLALRIQVESGGCHGFQYLMKLVTLPDSLPSLGEKDGGEASPDNTESAATSNAIVILDQPSLELLKGSKVDFTMELIGSQFKIVDNPLATSSCGCGTSFDIKI
ncbi:hypothetical protein N656DRAFT_473603 [Canariomyces notabilis]|uniref:Core domain-containing protein n=1 Tax=Canariomyces notabilis TaxID=2074819 RepID=A0AAN6TIF0_9PEZI|nr:hypothetical protein N656DRAFT_473603 [Canariomyces arenarius]